MKQRYLIKWVLSVAVPVLVYAYSSWERTAQHPKKQRLPRRSALHFQENPSTRKLMPIMYHILQTIMADYQQELELPMGDTSKPPRRRVHKRTRH